MTAETDTTEQTIRAQIQRFDDVLADPEWEWGAMDETWCVASHDTLTPLDSDLVPTPEEEP